MVTVLRREVKAGTPQPEPLHVTAYDPELAPEETAVVHKVQPMPEPEPRPEIALGKTVKNPQRG